MPNKTSSETLFENAFEFASIGMALVSPDGKWLKVNHSLCKHLGYTEEELAYLDFQKLTHPDDLKTDLIFAEELLAGKRSSYQMEKRYIHKNGTTLWSILSVSLIRREDGSPKFFISQIQDINQLKLAQEMAALWKMSIGIAHEINNPLTIIALNSTAIRKLIESKDFNIQLLTKHNQTIWDAMERIGRSVSRLKSYSRPD